MNAHKVTHREVWTVGVVLGKVFMVGVGFVPPCLLMTGGCPLSETSVYWPPDEQRASDTSSLEGADPPVNDDAFGENGSDVDSYEPDDDWSQANSIDVGQTQTHSIIPAGDEDWLQFTLTSTSDVTIETSGTSGDTVLALFDASGALIAFNDDGGVGLFSLISEYDLASGTYYIGVAAYGIDSEIESYEVSLLIY